MCALQSRRIDRIFKSQLPAIAIAALVATLASGCQTPAENNGIPTTLALSVIAASITVNGASIQVEAKLLNDSGQPIEGVSIVFDSDSGEFVPGSVISTNAAGIAAVTLKVAEPTTIRALALDGLIVSNAVEIEQATVAEEPITLSIELDSGRPRAESRASIKFRATRNDNLIVNESIASKRVRGKLRVTFGDDTKTRNFSDFARELVVQHRYEEPGKFLVEAVLELISGQVITKRKMITVLEPDDGGSSPTPRGPPTVPPDADDDLDLSTVRFLHTNVSGWKVTSTVTGTRITTQEICIFHTGASKWPAPGKSYGNPWIIAKIGGTWYAGTFEWMRPGQACKALNPAGGGTIAKRIGPHVKVEPLKSWRPKKGEIVGLMMSGKARDSRRSVEQRSNVVLVKWPF